jgi:hypothetical protein
VEQVIPLKSAEEYTIRLREKRQEERAAARHGGTMEDFWPRCRPIFTLKQERCLIGWNPR